MARKAKWFTSTNGERKFFASQADAEAAAVVLREMFAKQERDGWIDSAAAMRVSVRRI